MLLRICLILTILAGLGTAYVALFPVKEIITTTRDARNEYNKKWTDETAAHNKTKKVLSETKTELATTKTKLADTQTQLEAANTKIADLDKQTADLTDKLNKTTARAEGDEQKLEAYRELPPPDQIKGIITQLAETTKARDAIIAEKKIMESNRRELRRQLDALIGENTIVVLPEGLHGKVLAVDPKYDFVVLNIGDEQGAKERGEMMVNRKGQLIGKVRISRVEKDTCVATIMPGWKRGQVMEGDQVLY